MSEYNLFKVQFTILVTRLAKLSGSVNLVSVLSNNADLTYQKQEQISGNQLALTVV
jgi:hypothetical protein